MTVRNIDEDVKRRFVEKARRRGQSAEALLREVVRQAALAPDDEREDGLSALMVRIEKEARELPDDAQAEIDEARAAARMWRATDQFQ